MNARRRPDAVTFDCWNTLLRERDAQLPRALRVAALIEAAAKARVEVSEQAAADALRAAFDRHIALWVEGVASGALEIAGWSLGALGVGDAGAAGLLAPRLEEASLAGTCEALAGAGEVLETLRSGDMRIALICDTGMSPGRVVRQLLERAGLLCFLEVQVFSNEVGVPKPHRSMFEAALGPLGVEAARAVHVGDLRRTDVQGARAMGMGTVRIRAEFDDPAPLDDADAVVDAHDELPDALRRLTRSRALDPSP